MNFLQNLFGSQYYEISNRGGDIGRGRRNGNLFLSAFVILLIIALAAIIFTFTDCTMRDLEQSFKKTFGLMSGKAIGRLLAIPILAIIYFIIIKTVGSESSYNKYIEAFNQQPEEEKNKANAKVLIPFFIVLACLFILAMSSLF